VTVAKPSGDLRFVVVVTSRPSWQIARGLPPLPPGRPGTKPARPRPSVLS